MILQSSGKANKKDSESQNGNAAPAPAPAQAKKPDGGMSLSYKLEL